MEIGILNAGAGSWVFESLANNLSAALWINLVREPVRYNYVLGWEGPSEILEGRSFVPPQAIQIASDKRRIARAFLDDNVPSPRTLLCEDVHAVKIALQQQTHQWVLKYPTGSGASGHRLLKTADELPRNWPTPFVLQEFIEMPRPEVYRLYGVSGKLFGFNARRFSEETKPSPWVAHARGARYVHDLKTPDEAREVAEQALKATGLWGSMGCVDLLQRSSGEWLALEVGTDGISNHIDREVDSSEFIRDLDRRTAEAFWAWIGKPVPWPGDWHYRTT